MTTNKLSAGVGEDFFNAFLMMRVALRWRDESGLIVGDLKAWLLNSVFLWMLERVKVGFIGLMV